MRVLIIDDDEDVVFSLQTILCAKGVEVVGTGTDGWNLARPCSYFGPVCGAVYSAGQDL